MLPMDLLLFFPHGKRKQKQIQSQNSMTTKPMTTNLMTTDFPFSRKQKLQQIQSQQIQ